MSGIPDIGALHRSRLASLTPQDDGLEARFY
jgi:hypothetical protein